MIYKIAIGSLIVLCLGLMWRSSNINGRLSLEQAEHEQTRLKLSQALVNADLWQAAAKEGLQAAKAQQGALAACLNRETQAAADAVTRKNIAKQIKPQARPAQELIVDADTRRTVINRLNRAINDKN